MYHIKKNATINQHMSLKCTALQPSIEYTDRGSKAIDKWL